MKTGISVLAIVVLSSSVTVLANAAGPNTETRSVAGFEAIEVGGSVDLQLQQGPAFSVAVESPDGPASDVLTEVRNGTLRVHDERPWFQNVFSGSRHRHTVHVTLPKLTALTASGGSNVSSRHAVTGERLELTASGGADVTLDVAVASLDVSTSGGADLRLSGTARQARMRSSGGSDLDASRLTTETANLSSSGGSDISIGQSGTLVASASGGSDISYSGEPHSLTVSKSGGGGVARR